MFKIIEIQDIELKSNITDCILRKLPEWFDIEEAIVEYVEGVKDTKFYVAYDLEKPIGFISIKHNNEYTSEIYVIGVLKEYQGKHIGKSLVEVANNTLADIGTKFLQVKTLGPSNSNKYYADTRKFYEGVGFYPLEEIKELWDEINICLIMIKNIKLKNSHKI
ncbi:GNAT family N-acetyltransferase [Paeniclostridium sordellii]|uniref:GNAT family N-acetyltransferase n=1 Tax=Paraclostridium sordellii TaxID=1505 RepID=UPI0005E1B815|nr:GNAT family N-acetyltransferase [Paeniclostridium sordellii]MRZ79452.1 GNAT family N-acetyltransferase [Paeniclostridium sordellii]MSB59367.1 GNAT family N-acetyltransferase [Paeniclostridium sordellii]RGW99410.1 N-acetyltransferase [Paeniclostridium sordellii]CEN24292.1 N-acetyltransferase GCN5 [[Clostridium] sordellii] [Paeniclostridium sordellii]